MIVEGVIAAAPADTGLSDIGDPATLERHGLTREGVHAAFADYIARHRIPVKQGA